MESNISIIRGPESVENAGKRFYVVLLASHLALPSSLWSSLKPTDIPEILAPVSVSQWVPTALVSAMLLAIPFIAFYIATWKSFAAHSSKRMPVRVPPTVPYLVPYLGSALIFGLSPSKCVAATRRTVGSQAAYGLKVLGDTIYFLHGPENVTRIWKYKTSITTPGVQTFCLIRVFGMAIKAVNMYNLDDSGILPKPDPASDVKPHNRIDHLTHAGFNKLLNGDGLSNLYLRWSQSFACRLQSLGIGDRWMELPDMMSFWMPSLTASLNEAIAGPLLECVNPNFTRDFIKFLPFVHGLMKGLPSWCLPGAFSLRASLNRDVKQWQAIARARFRDSDIDSDGDADPWWGSACMRERQKILAGVDNWDHETVASSDFGLLWGANINVHTAAIWTIIEIFKDENLLSRVREELKTIDFTTITSSHDVEKILSLPLLQSVYAEVLRLRVEVQSVFCSDREDIQINEWCFPKKSLVLVPTGPAHMDPNFWNTRDGEHPLNTFWADRFLVYPNDPRSGPRRKTAAALGRIRQDRSQDIQDPGEPRFISAGMADSFMPYGVGERTCPGRFFARREIVAFCANIFNDFDIELLTTEKNFKSSSTFYGLGTQRPLGSVPFKIRRRANC